VNDQAASLRRLAAGAPRTVRSPACPVPTYVLGSGKGGVGKSVLAVMLGVTLAARGRRVLLFDGSQNQGNLHILLGVHPAPRLEALLTGAAQPADLLVEVRERLWLVPADSGAEALHALGPTDRARLHVRLSGLYDGFDAVIVDSGPGVEGVVRAAATRASRLIAVAIPEPASLSDAYATIKLVHLQAPSLPVDVLVNRVEDDLEGAATFERLALAAKRFLHRDLGFLGAVRESEALRRAARRPGALLDASDDPISAIADALDALERSPVPTAESSAA
jgi:flagellar biosynthesis protein FlhG